MGAVMIESPKSCRLSNSIGRRSKDQAVGSELPFAGLMVHRQIQGEEAVASPCGG